jgi:hypothetical protein
MMATSHALVGGIIAVSVKDPVLAGGLILTSHFLLDMIPHWDFGTEWEHRSKLATGLLAMGETAVALLLMIILFLPILSWPMLLFAFCVAELPDWAEAPWYIFFAKQGKKPELGHHNVLWHLFYQIDKFEDYFHTRATFPFGVITQIATVIFFFLLLQK